MNDIKLTNLIENRDLFSSMLSCMKLLRENDLSKPRTLIRMLRLLNERQLFRNQGQVQEVCAVLETYASQGARYNSSMTAERREFVRKTLVEIRLQLVLLATGASDNSSSASAFASFSGPIEYHSGDVISAKIDSNRIVLLPQIGEASDLDEIAEGLQEAYATSNRGETWVVDCSAIQEMPLAVLSMLMAYYRMFRKQRRRLLVSWLNQAALPKNGLSEVLDYLRLFGRAGNLFSRDASSTPASSRTKTKIMEIDPRMLADLANA